MKRNIFSILLIFALALGLWFSQPASPALAATCQSDASGPWNADATWDAGCTGPGGIPQIGDIVIIRAGHTVTLTQDESIGSALSPNSALTLQTGGILDLVTFHLTARVVTAASGAVIRQGGTFQGPNITATFTLDTNSTYIYYGPVSQLSTAQPIYGNLNWESTASGNSGFNTNLVINGNLIINSTNPLTSFNGTNFPRVHTIRGNIIIQNGVLGGAHVASGTSTINLDGNLQINSGEIFYGALFTAGNVILNVGGNIISNGTFHHGDGTGIFTVNMDGTSAQTISGSGTLLLENLNINNTTTGGVTLNRSMNAIGTMTVAANALFDANGFAVTAGTLTNNGTLRQTLPVNGAGAVGFFDTGGYGGVRIDADGLDLGSTVVTIRGNQVCDSQNFFVHRCFDITPTNTTGRSAVIEFSYAPGELNNKNCATMNAYRYTGSAWGLAGPLADRSCGAAPYSITAYPVSSFSPFRLSSEAPTAVFLSALGIRQAPSTLTWLLAGAVLLVVLLGGGVLLRKRAALRP